MSMANAIPYEATAVLVLADGTTIFGRGFGANVTRVGQIVFNTSITGYQEIITDLSYTEQIIIFTFPHVGNVGTNVNDYETASPTAIGCVLRADITGFSNYRAEHTFNDWLKFHDLPCISRVDTRWLTRRIRDDGITYGALCVAYDGKFDVDSLQKQTIECSDLKGIDLVKKVTCKNTYSWDTTLWSFAKNSREDGYGRMTAAKKHVVAIDYGAKRNMLRNLADICCRVTVVPANTTAEEIFDYRPDGIFLTNGPGDPTITSIYAVPEIKKLIDSDKPIFGICLGHQLLALALGAETIRMHIGHRGSNHPVKDLETGKVEITTQNHGFVVAETGLPHGVTITHCSLFDRSVEGIKVDNKPIFSVQYHPEASPGPTDSRYLFTKFLKAMSG
ncbi:carbamoyl-phosphate synthase, small subunit [Candidatus Endolissoclinum faulkneri L2]|uniref:Carbamoyl phosphate synthase small chain n=1 Tax=Candidatus Endolissoclinum faulkneri L2 TaxID=1193729 RepID=K7YPJ1_9PROT|nr:glutamine-hydrolyzing carbamoyl-phosphate synthase small subunit [Candidatus Endolissoclinum faulkneri]AFX98474.1 carbamoyl-phosphate synthase, small subunit [Candidatus Endolissoclinum faulkneri L2]